LAQKLEEVRKFSEADFKAKNGEKNGGKSGGAEGSGLPVFL